jgi:uncharacterized membrane protein
MFDIQNMTIQEVTLLVVVVLVGISFITGIISLILETDRTRQWYGDWFQGVSTEMIGAAMTTIFFTFIVGAVEERQATLALQTDLMQGMGSTVNIEAIRAVEELSANGWLTDGTLEGAQLDSANLAGASMRRVDLSEANLFAADLSFADLEGGNLQDAFLQGANLRETNLRAVNLQNAVLSATDLGGVDLTEADLRGARLDDANLTGADLTNARFDENTVLPSALYDSDAQAFLPTWSSDTDMAQFTDPEHPDYWRPIPPYPWWYEEE